MTDRLSSGLRFRFRLTPLAAVEPFGTPPDQKQHWFGLTDGAYWLDIGGTELLRYSAVGRERCDETVESYADYYVARLWEDVLQWATAVLERVPDDLVTFMGTDPSRSDDDDADGDGDGDDALRDALIWHDRHSLDLGYLVNPPRLRAWRGGPDDLVTMVWHHRPADRVAWAGPSTGRVQLSVDAFSAAVQTFDEELIGEMAVRVREVLSGALEPGVEVDLDQLEREQRDRSTWLTKRMAGGPPPTNWAVVREGSDAIRGSSRWTDSTPGRSPYSTSG